MHKDNKISEINKINQAFIKTMNTDVNKKSKNPIKIAIRFYWKIKLLIIMKYQYSCLYDAVLLNIKQRTIESEITYRYFRFIHNSTKNKYRNI